MGSNREERGRKTRLVRVLGRWAVTAGHDSVSECVWKSKMIGHSMKIHSSIALSSACWEVSLTECKFFITIRNCQSRVSEDGTQL